MTTRPLITALALSSAVLFAMSFDPALSAAPAATGGEDSENQGEGQFRPSSHVVIEGPGIFATFEADRLADRFGAESEDGRSGRVFAGPLTLRKRIDASSPSLERALVNAEPLRVTIELGEWWGDQWVFSATIQLQDALLIGLRQGLTENALADFADGRGELWEELSLKVHQFEFTWLETGATASWTADDLR